MSRTAPNPAPQASPSTSLLIGVALIAGATLAYQVVLTRLLSAALACHFSFLACFFYGVALLQAARGPWPSES